MLQVPIVASTGGLFDTVREGFTGFQMGSFNVDVSECTPTQLQRTQASFMWLSHIQVSKFNSYPDPLKLKNKFN